MAKGERMPKRTEATDVEAENSRSPFLGEDVLAVQPEDKLNSKLENLAALSPFPEAFLQTSVPERLEVREADEVMHPADVSFEEEVPPPKGVPAFEHFCQPMKPSEDGLAWVPDGDEQRLTPLNPGFIDDKDAIEPSPLQAALSTLLTENPDFSRYLARDSIRLKRARPDDKIRVALVDLTEKRLTKPEFAGWGSTVAVDSGSAIKIAVLCAAFQLKFDLEHVAKKGGITTVLDLVQFVDKGWQKAGIIDRPKLAEIFNGDQNPPNLAFADDFEDAVDHIVFHEANVASSILIDKLTFPYIASVLWHSGLRHSKRGGMWMYWNFDPDRPRVWKDPARPAPGPVFPHTGTALSIATFFTLLAQGRLPNQAYSGEAKRRLQETWYGSLFPAATISAKVGLLFNVGNCLRWETVAGKRQCAAFEVTQAHEGDLIENGRLRYAAAIMTTGIQEGAGLLMKLIVKLNDLISANNP
jgi:hypothetical protein